MQCCIGCPICAPVVQLCQGLGCGLEAGELPWQMCLADGVAGVLHILEGQARQGLQCRVEIEHLAAFAPGAVDDHQPKSLWRLRPGQRQGTGGSQPQGCILLCGIGVEQQAVAWRTIGISIGICICICPAGPSSMQSRFQLGGIEFLAHHDPAMRQAQMQQMPRALGFVHLHGMHEDQHFDLMRDRLGQRADAGAQCPVTVGAAGRGSVCS